jgi:carboxy-cis,cis-muconate cyclase
VVDPTTLRLEKNITSEGACFNKTSAFVQGTTKAPYHVVMGNWPGPQSCGMAMTVHPNGTLDKVVDSWRYANESGIHGLDLWERDNQTIVYSADLNGDLIWTHSLDRSTGKVMEIGRVSAPAPGMHPRHLAIHTKGKYIYVLMESDNSLVAYNVDSITGAANKNVTTYSLIPDGK